MLLNTSTPVLHSYLFLTHICTFFINSNIVCNPQFIETNNRVLENYNELNEELNYLILCKCTAMYNLKAKCATLVGSLK